MSIGRSFASGQFTVAIGVIHFLNEYFICKFVREFSYMGAIPAEQLSRPVGTRE